MKKFILLIIFLFFNPFVFAQYIGVVCLGESEYVQKITMDLDGNIQIGELYPSGYYPRRVDITDKGLVVVCNEGYYYSLYLTLSVLRIDIKGNINKIRDYDLSGYSVEVKNTKDNKYCLVTHEVENNPQYEWGITVLELMENDINPYKRQFFPDETVGELAISGTGLVFGLESRYVQILQMDSDGVLTDTGQLIDIGDTGNGEVEVAPDNKYAYVTNDSGSASGLVVLEIDENNNVTKKGRATGSSMQGCGELIVSKDSKTVLLIGIQGMEVYNVQANGDVVFNGQYFWLPLAQSAAMTPDGKFVVIAYDYRLEQEGLLSTLAVFKMNSDGTVTNLNKDVTLENLPGEMKFYQLPTPSVDIDWQMYE